MTKNPVKKSDSPKESTSPSKKPIKKSTTLNSSTNKPSTDNTKIINLRESKGKTEISDSDFVPQKRYEFGADYDLQMTKVTQSEMIKPSLTQSEIFKPSIINNNTSKLPNDKGTIKPSIKPSIKINNLETIGDVEGNRNTGESDNSRARNNTMPIDLEESLERIKKLQVEDFDLLDEVGSGSYAEVYLVRRKAQDKEEAPHRLDCKNKKHIPPHKYRALKMINKRKQQRENKTHHVVVERTVLSHFSHKCLIKLYSYFTDSSTLYFELEFCQNGEFSRYMHEQQILPTKEAQFYAAECVSILEFLHSNGIAHRDFKPENLLLDENYHLKVCDFGTAKFFPTKDNDKFIHKINEYQMRIRGLEKEDKNSLGVNDGNEGQLKADRGTFVGTLFYISPEMLKNQSGGPACDYWALGVIIYKMLTNEYPFNGSGSVETFKSIKNCSFKFPDIAECYLDINSKDLISKLLVLNPQDRLGCGEPGTKNDLNALKNHPFFKNINWKNQFYMQAPIKRDTKIFAEALVKIHNLEKKKLRVMKTGLVKKYKVFGQMWNTRQLILYNDGRLEYFDPDSNEKKGEIVLCKDCDVELWKDHKFKQSVPGRVFEFKVKGVDFAQSWVDVIDVELKKFEPD